MAIYHENNFFFAILNIKLNKIILTLYLTLNLETVLYKFIVYIANVVVSLIHNDGDATVLAANNE